MAKKLILWVLVIVCMATIFCFSAQEANDSGRVSEGFTYNIIKFFDFNDTITDERAMEIADNMDGFIRKLAHFCIYALLGFLIALLLNEYRYNYSKVISGAVSISFLYSCTDEFHQYFVPGRSGQVSDVALDTFGALCGAVFAVIIIVLIRKHKENTPPKAGWL